MKCNDKLIVFSNCISFATDLLHSVHRNDQNKTPSCDQEKITEYQEYSFFLHFSFQKGMLFAITKFH